MFSNRRHPMGRLVLSLLELQHAACSEQRKSTTGVSVRSNISLAWVNTQRYFTDVIPGFSRRVGLHKGASSHVTVES